MLIDSVNMQGCGSLRVVVVTIVVHNRTSRAPRSLSLALLAAVTRMSGSIAANFFVVITSDDNAVIITVHT